MEPSRRKKRSPRTTLTLGLAGFSRISAVEGISLSRDSQRMFAEFDRDGLTDEQRRKVIADKHARKD